jgi:hypothetical protein
MLPALLLIAASAASAQSDLETSVSSALSAARAANARPAVRVDDHALGSWFRKISSVDTDAFDGITGWGTLPWPTFDPGRMHEAVAGEGAFASGPLDNPGVYLGAHADGREIDAGLKWDHRYDAQGHDTGKFAWRVFWRVASPSGNVWANPKPGSPEDVYLEPGARFAMTLRVRPDGTARLDVRGAGAGAAGVAEVFPADGFWNGAAPLPRTFKRVHAIDQFILDGDGRRIGDEGRPALPTRALLNAGRWDGTSLLGAAAPVPLTGGIAVEWRGPDAADRYGRVFPGAFVDAAGGEGVIVTPPQP